MVWPRVRLFSYHWQVLTAIAAPCPDGIVSISLNISGSCKGILIQNRKSIKPLEPYAIPVYVNGVNARCVGTRRHPHYALKTWG